MPALLINIRIDVQEKFEFFQVTLADLSGLFEECHVKIRGKYSQVCIEYAQSLIGTRLRLYQALPEADWIAATLQILSEVESRSIFLYFEDHKLIASKDQLEQTLEDFDNFKLDYLCYSFFKASQLDANNLLPLGVKQHNAFVEFSLSKEKLRLLGKISPNYYTYSLMSVISVAYFREILAAENAKVKLYSRLFVATLSHAFPYPKYRKAFRAMNSTLSQFGVILCIYPPSSPFNLERIWFESIFIDRSWKYGILKKELFANYDDDNGAYSESLIKRGLYPFSTNSLSAHDEEKRNQVVRIVSLESGENFDCTYFSHNGRIRYPPQAVIKVIGGRISVNCRGANVTLKAGDTKSFYSNLSPMIECLEQADLEILIRDEIF